MTKRTQAEIDAQIEGLKKDRANLPEFSSFGDKNWEKIDTQISVLEGKTKPDDYYEDETAEEYEDGDNDIWQAAEEAEQWLLGNSNENLFDED